ncbi:MAG: hypothetical protein ACQEQN_09720 [Thermodesulfobacteriota bacterium]
MTGGNMYPGLQSVMEVFRAHGFGVTPIADGFQVALEDGDSVDMYMPSSDSMDGVACIQSIEQDEEANASLLSGVHRMLAEKMAGIAEIEPFTPSKDPDDPFSYYARIDMTHAPDYHETVMMEAGEEDEEEVEEVAVEEEVEIEIEGHAPMEAENDGTLLAEAVSRMETIDAGMLRLALDSMALPRTNSVRVALTRLYRSAIDVAELSEALEKEAAKITRPSDIDALEKIRQDPSAAFLVPLVELLLGKIAG